MELIKKEKSKKMEKLKRLYFRAPEQLYHRLIETELIYDLDAIVVELLEEKIDREFNHAKKG